MIRIWHRVGHLVSHRHDSSPGVGDLGAVGIRATKVSLVMLGSTAGLQSLIVMVSGSVALASDTIHNLGDALTSIPLWIAFALGRRRPSRTFTYGLHRAEDLAGLVIVLAIFGSALVVGWESVRRLSEPRPIDQIPWVVVAGVVGALGNELVARYRLRVGRRIGSEALIADGWHARSDAWTSLAVVAAGVGAAWGLPWVDPVAGLVVALVIVTMLVPTARGLGRRLLDGVDPDLVTVAEDVIRSFGEVRQITDLRLRFQGHQLHVVTGIQLDPDLSLTAGHETAHRVERELRRVLAVPMVVTVHVEPHGDSETHHDLARQG